ncbi:MAG: hypothetical protein J6C85_01180 [Alphaproteobacteria bacterium]|nr:hypothetical protein [Alphaproteobacteria bacterium]
MKKLNEKEQLAQFTPQNQAALGDYVKEGHELSPQTQLLMFDHPQADDLVVAYVGNGHVLSQEALLKVFTLSPMHAQLIMELCVAYDFWLSEEVQLKLLELKYPKTIVRRFIRQNKGENDVSHKLYQKAKALRYI